MVQEPRGVRSAPHHLQCSAKKAMCYLQFMVLMSSREFGVALRAGLLAPLEPRKLVFPSRAAIPDAKRRIPRTSAVAGPIGSSFIRTRVTPLNASNGNDNCEAAPRRTEKQHSLTPFIRTTSISLSKRQ